MSNIVITPPQAKLKLDFARPVAFNFDLTSLGQPPVDWVCPKAYTFYRITFDPVNNGQDLIIDWGQRDQFKVNGTSCQLGVEDWAAGQSLMDAFCEDYSFPNGIDYPFNWFVEAAIDVNGDNLVDDDLILKSNLASLDYEGFTCISVGVTSTGLTWQEASGNLQTTDYLIKVETTEGIVIAEKTISSAAVCENGDCDLDLAIILPDLSPATYVVRISVVNQSELRFKAVSYTIGQETSRSHLLPLPPVTYSGLSNR